MRIQDCCGTEPCKKKKKKKTSHRQILDGPALQVEDGMVYAKWVPSLGTQKWIWMSI